MRDKSQPRPLACEWFVKADPSIPTRRSDVCVMSSIFRFVKNDRELKSDLVEWVLANLQSCKLNAIGEKYFHRSLPAEFSN